ncbi:MAG: helix-turn-helix domain-containing protein [Oscillospiraceae bacterium]|nr:helix-turn-helix domain-containing protein [Oscillospiraceae bacterium]
MQHFIKTSLEYIEHNLKTDITAEELAQTANYSVRHYCRLFSQITGSSVANYIAKKRINHALAEISSGRKAIDAVLDYGFDTYSGFYRAFVKMYGCSPKKYLMMCNNLTPKELKEAIMDNKSAKKDMKNYHAVNSKSIEKLCESLSIGTLTSEPAHIYWGYSNKVYEVTTTQGKYAVKALNPRGQTLEDAVFTEKIVGIAAKRVKAVPAKIFNGKIVQETDGQLYLVFDWIEGDYFSYDDITPEHSRIMGGVLADIHQIDFSALNLSSEVSPRTRLADWGGYLQKGKESAAAWVGLLEENIDMIQEYYAKGVKALNSLTEKNIVSHRVLDPRHVIWQGYTPYLVDWKSAGMINPLDDFLKTALHWSEHGSEKDKDRFLAFAHGYTAKTKLPKVNWQNVIINRYLEGLDWLEFNLERSLNCTDSEEQQIATGQVEDMIRGFIRTVGDSDRIKKLEKWLGAL